jgi:hypothetical protein
MTRFNDVQLAFLLGFYCGCSRMRIELQHEVEETINRLSKELRHEFDDTIDRLDAEVAATMPCKPSSRASRRSPTLSRPIPRVAELTPANAPWGLELVS